MAIIGYVMFLGVNYLLLLQLFRFTTYHQWFSRAVWAIVGFAVIAGIAMDAVGLAPFFIWHVAVIATLFWAKWNNESRKASDVLAAVGEDDEAAKVLQLSMASTRAYYWLSVVIYILVFSVAFVAKYNL